MEKLTIICVDDQRTVLNTLMQDLRDFEAYCQIEACESAQEAAEVIEDLDQEGDWVAVIISDQVMPGKSGVEWLTEVQKDSRFQGTRKVLLTGLATHQDTIEAINRARIDQYLEKPWQVEELQAVVRKLLTRFILEKGLDYQQYTPVLDQEVLFESLRTQT